MVDACPTRPMRREIGGLSTAVDQVVALCETQMVDNRGASIKSHVEVQVGALKTLAHLMDRGADRLIHDTEKQAVRDWASTLRSISEALTRAVNQEPSKVSFWNRAGVRIASGVLGAAGLGLVGGVGEGLAEDLFSGDPEIRVQVQVVSDGAAMIDELCEKSAGSPDDAATPNEEASNASGKHDGVIAVDDELEELLETDAERIVSSFQQPTGE